LSIGGDIETKTAEPSAFLISLRSNDYFIGFELNKEYFDKACKRIDAERRQLSLF
jgi:hypothetical protein